MSTQFETLSKELFYKKLQSYAPDFDYNASLMLTGLGIKDTDGVYIPCRAFVDFATQWNKRFVDVIDITTTKDSFQAGKLFYIKWKPVKASAKVDVVVKDVDDDVVIVQEDASEKKTTTRRTKTSK
jgi:hypothetical protein